MPADAHCRDLIRQLQAMIARTGRRYLRLSTTYQPKNADTRTALSGGRQSMDGGPLPKNAESDSVRV